MDPKPKSESPGSSKEFTSKLETAISSGNSASCRTLVQEHFTILRDDSFRARENPDRSLNFRRNLFQCCIISLNPDSPCHESISLIGSLYRPPFAFHFAPPLLQYQLSPQKRPPFPSSEFLNFEHDPSPPQILINSYLSICNGRKPINEKTSILKSIISLLRPLSTFFRTSPRQQLGQYKNYVAQMWQGLFKKEMYNDSPFPKPHHLLKVFALLEHITHCTHSHSDAISTAFRFIRALSVNLLSFEPAWDYGIPLLAHVFKAISSQCEMNQYGQIVTRQPPNLDEHVDNASLHYSSVLENPLVVNASATLEGFSPNAVWEKLNTVQPQNTHTTQCLRDVKQYLTQLYPFLQLQLDAQLNTAPAINIHASNVVLSGPNAVMPVQPSPHNYITAQPTPNQVLPITQQPSSRLSNQLPSSTHHEPLSAPISSPSAPPHFTPFAIDITNAKHLPPLTEHTCLPRFVDPDPQPPPKRIVSNYAVFASSPFSAEAATSVDFRRQMSIFAGKAGAAADSKDALTSDDINTFGTLFKKLFVDRPVEEKSGQTFLAKDSVIYVVGVFRTERWAMGVPFARRKQMSDVLVSVLSSESNTDSVVAVIGSMLSFADYFEFALSDGLFGVVSAILDRRKDLDLSPISTFELCQTLLDSFTSFHQRVFHHYEQSLHLSLVSQQENSALDNTIIVAPCRGDTAAETTYLDHVRLRLNVMKEVFVHLKGKEGVTMQRRLVAKLEQALTVGEAELRFGVFWRWWTADPQPDVSTQLWEDELKCLAIGTGQPNPLPTDQTPYPRLAFDPPRMDRVEMIYRQLIASKVPNSHPRSVVFTRVFLSIHLNGQALPPSLSAKSVPRVLMDLLPAMTLPTKTSQQTQFFNTLNVILAIVTTFKPTTPPQKVLDKWTEVDTHNSHILAQFDKIYQQLDEKNTTLTRLSFPSPNTNWPLLFSPERTSTIHSALSNLDLTSERIEKLTKAGGTEWFIRWLTNSQFGREQELDQPTRTVAFSSLSAFLGIGTQSTLLKQTLKAIRTVPHLVTGKNFTSSTNSALVLAISALNSFFSNFSIFVPPLRLFEKPTKILADTTLTTLSLSDGKKPIDTSQFKLTSSASDFTISFLSQLNISSEKTDIDSAGKEDSSAFAVAYTLLTHKDLKLVEAFEEKKAAWIIPLFILLSSCSNNPTFQKKIDALVATLAKSTGDTLGIVQRTILNFVSVLLSSEMDNQNLTCHLLPFLQRVLPIINPRLDSFCAALIRLILSRSSLHSVVRNTTQFVFDEVKNQKKLQTVSKLLDWKEKESTVPHSILTRLSLFGRQPSPLVPEDRPFLYELLLSFCRSSKTLLRQTLDALQLIQANNDKETPSPIDAEDEAPICRPEHISFMEEIFTLYQQKLYDPDKDFSHISIFFSFCFNTLLNHHVDSPSRFGEMLVSFQNNLRPGLFCHYLSTQHNAAGSSSPSVLVSAFSQTHTNDPLTFESLLANDITRSLSQQNQQPEISKSVVFVVLQLEALLLVDLSKSIPTLSERLLSFVSNTSNNTNFSDLLIQLEARSRSASSNNGSLAQMCRLIAKSHSHVTSISIPFVELLGNLFRCASDSKKDSLIETVIRLLTETTHVFLDSDKKWTEEEDGVPFSSHIFNLWRFVVSPSESSRDSLRLFSLIRPRLSLLFSLGFVEQVSGISSFTPFISSFLSPHLSNPSDGTLLMEVSQHCLQLISDTHSLELVKSVFEMLHKFHPQPEQKPSRIGRSKPPPPSGPLKGYTPKELDSVVSTLLKNLRPIIPSPTHRLHPEKELSEKILRAFGAESHSLASQSDLGRDSSYGSSRQHVTEQFDSRYPPNPDPAGLVAPSQHNSVISKATVRVDHTDGSRMTSQGEMYISPASTRIVAQSGLQGLHEITRPKDFVQSQDVTQFAFDPIRTQSEKDTPYLSSPSLDQRTQPQTRNSHSFTQDAKSDFNHHSQHSIDDLEELSGLQTTNTVLLPTNQPAETKKTHQSVPGQIEVPNPTSSARILLSPPAVCSTQSIRSTPPTNQSAEPGRNRQTVTAQISVQRRSPFSTPTSSQSPKTRTEPSKAKSQLNSSTSSLPKAKTQQTPILPKTASRISRNPDTGVPATPADRTQALLKEVSEKRNKANILFMLKQKLLKSKPANYITVEKAINFHLAKKNSGGHFLVVSPSKDSVKCIGVYVMTEEGELESVITLKSSIPTRITQSQIQFYLHYETGHQTFSVQQVSTFTVSTDVVVLHPTGRFSRSRL